MKSPHKYFAFKIQMLYKNVFKCLSSPEPCSPLNVSSRLICSSNTAQVSWAASANAATYTVTAGSGGQTITCNSPSTNCTLSNLVCGQAYDILVKASDGTCISNNSAPFQQDEGTGRCFFK